MIDGLSDVYFPVSTDHLDKSDGHLASTSANWIHLANKFCVSKDDGDNLMALRIQSPSEALFDFQPSAHQDITIVALIKQLENIPRMDLISGNKEFY